MLQTQRFGQWFWSSLFSRHPHGTQKVSVSAPEREAARLRHGWQSARSRRLGHLEFARGANTAGVLRSLLRFAEANPGHPRWKENARTNCPPGPMPAPERAAPGALRIRPG